MGACILPVPTAGCCFNKCRGKHVDDGTLARLLGDWQANAGTIEEEGDGQEGGAGHGSDGKRLFVGGKEVTEEQLKSILHVSVHAFCQWLIALPLRLHCSELAIGNGRLFSAWEL